MSEIYFTAGPRPNPDAFAKLKSGDILVLMDAEWGEADWRSGALMRYEQVPCALLSLQHSSQFVLGLLTALGAPPSIYASQEFLHFSDGGKFGYIHTGPPVTVEDVTESMGITHREYHRSYSVRYNVRQSLVSLESILERFGIARQAFA